MLIADRTSMPIRDRIERNTPPYKEKAWIHLTTLHERVANANADFQHKLSRAIVDENQAVIVNSQHDEKNNLARATCDANWHGFITKLEYKVAEKDVLW